jgi:hypothetical protein
MLSRRRLVQSSLLGAAAPAAAAAADKKGPPTAGRGRRLWYELRTYHARIGPQAKVLGDFLAEVYLPTLGRLGVRPVGGFTRIIGEGIPSITLLLPHESPAAFAAVHGRLPAELAKVTSPAGRAYLDATSAAPPYVRVESRLLEAFESFPGLEPPPGGTGKKRIFELRTYASPTERALDLKIEMFGPRMGETEIFRRVGLTPVFFGKNVIGGPQPCLTYMLAFPDLAAREQAWATFRADPAWERLKATPGYADAELLTNIDTAIWAPTAWSQV